ncbi:MAG: hypothetical protein JXQ96_14805 [Cyclobacteriaceae bacterium]
MKQEWNKDREFFILKHFESLKDEYFNDFKVKAVFKPKGMDSPRINWGGMSESIKEHNHFVAYG